MKRSIANVSLVVRDYDEAIAWYTRCLGFVLLEDVALPARKRWVRVAPANDTGAALLLARASEPEQLARVGNQTGGRVFLFLHTDDFWRDYRNMQAHGVPGLYFVGLDFLYSFTSENVGGVGRDARHIAKHIAS